MTMCYEKDDEWVDDEWEGEDEDEGWDGDDGFGGLWDDLDSYH